MRLGRTCTASLVVLIVLSTAKLWAEGPSPVEPGPQAGNAVVDGMFIGRITQEGDKLIADGKSTPAETLVGELDRKQADVALAVPDPKAKPIDAESLFERTAKCTLIVGGLYKCDKCQHTHCNAASAWIIDKSGIAVTNYHVVNNKKNMTLVMMTRDGRVLPVKEVLAADQVKDVAIVKLDVGDKPFTDALQLAPAAAHVGADAFVLSHPNNRFYSFTRGMVSRYFNAQMPQGNVTLMQITADYAKGSSGGPILNAAGQVIGMVAATTSVYYNEANGQPQNLQMVFKDCVTAASIQSLIKQPKTASAEK